MKRIITGFVGVGLMIPVCIFSYQERWPLPLTLLWPLLFTFLSVLGTYEMLKCIGVLNEKALAIPSFLFSLTPAVVCLLTRYGKDTFFDRVFDRVDDPYRILFILGGVYFLVLLVIATFIHNRIPSEKLFATIGFVFYVVYSFSSMTLVRDLEGAGYYFLLMFIGAWGSDTFAYFGGRAFGRHKLAPEISPKKTVEGAISGVVGNVIFFLIYAWVIDHYFHPIRYMGFVLLGVLLAVIGQFGDLFASCIKRHYGVKDYGTLFPGHGGVLDRFDSVMAIADVFYLCIAAFGANLILL